MSDDPEKSRSERPGQLPEDNRKYDPGNIDLGFLFKGFLREGYGDASIATATIDVPDQGVSGPTNIPGHLTGRVDDVPGRS